MGRVAPTPGVKMVYLIARRATSSRDELVAHWFANHMPAVVARQHRARESGHDHAGRYVATLFDPASPAGEWDGMAQLWFEREPPAPSEPHGTVPADSFQERAQPYVPWATTEHVYLDGEVPVEPLTLNDPFPTTRSGFFKVVLLAANGPDVDRQTFVDYWLDVHAVNATPRLRQVGAIRYTVSTSVHDDEAYAGMAELTFPDADAWTRYLEERQPDDLNRWMSTGRSLVMHATTEMVGIP